MLRDERAVVVTNLNVLNNCYQRLNPILKRLGNISIICERRGFLMTETKYHLFLINGVGS